jgi:DNA polymerase III delta prime subunit
MTLFTEIVGNQTAKQHLSKLLEKKRVPHLLLFAGPEGVGKKLFAKDVAYAWLGIPPSDHHPDVSMFSPEGKTGMHSVHAVRDMMERIALEPYAAQGKVCIIDDADRMLPASSQALLKTLEEPPHHTLIILLSSQPDKLLTTIRSRAQLVRFGPLSKQELSQFFQDESDMLHASFGSLSHALKIREEGYGAIVKQLHTLFFETKRTLHDIVTFSQKAQAYFDEKKEALKKELLKTNETLVKEGSSIQKQKIELEIDGLVQMHFLQDVELLLQHIYQATQKHYLHNNQIHLLGSIEEHLIFAKQLLERSTPLAQALEAFFLRLSPGQRG